MVEPEPRGGLTYAQMTDLLEQVERNGLEPPKPPPAVIFDVDGTLCDVRPIRHLLASRDRDRYDRFHEASIHCTPNEYVSAAARKAFADGIAVLVVTGRSEKHRVLTVQWLSNYHIPCTALFMRPARDYRPDYEVKRDLLAEIRRTWRPIEAWDDNPAVIRLWNEEGLHVVEVPGWNEEATG